MSPVPRDVLIAALLGAGGWIIKDLLFGLFQKRSQLERVEWEYRLKEIYCPLYFWSGLIVMGMDKHLRDQVCEPYRRVMAQAAYMIPRSHYHTLVRLLETAQDQATSPVSVDTRDKLRAYLYAQIEVLNFMLYRSQDTGGVGDPAAILERYRRSFRFILIGLSHLLVWAVIALGLGVVLRLYERHGLDVLLVGAVLILLLVLVDTRSRSRTQAEIKKRIKANV